MGGAGRVKVWDPVVRLFHWSLVAAFVVAYASGDDFEGLHVVAGYTVAGLIGVRLLWGLVGTRHARFADFVAGPAETRRYLRSLLTGRPRHYLGHNPLGGWMIVALLLVVSAACWSGLKAYAEEGKGPLAAPAAVLVAPAHADDDRDRARERGARHRRDGGDEFWEEVHETLSHLALGLVVLHVLGALIASALHRENLVKAMITGYKQGQGRHS
jgi:cytochrome b